VTGLQRQQIVADYFTAEVIGCLPFSHLSPDIFSLVSNNTTPHSCRSAADVIVSDDVTALQLSRSID
jgi:hypothetical protein